MPFHSVIVGLLALVVVCPVVTGQKEGNCDVFYDGKCYNLLMSTGRMTVEEGIWACTDINAVPASIYSEAHFDRIVALLRSRIYIGNNYNHIWTGMTIDIEERRIRLRDGKWAPYVRWFSARPFTPARKHVGIHVSQDANNNSQGMFDEHDTYKLLGVLCEA